MIYDTVSNDSPRELPKSRLPTLYKYIQEYENAFTETLKEVVAIQSISQQSDCFSNIVKMLNLCEKKLKDLGAIVEIVENNDIVNRKKLPPVLFGNLFTDADLKTVCVYGYVDTLPAKKSDGWETEPFNLIEKNGRLYGRGASDNKGPLLCWLHALEIYKTTKNDIPVNIKFVIEGSAKLRSHGLDNILVTKREFFEDVDFMCLTVDKTSQEVPCLKYGFRGVSHFSLEVICAERSIHSGIYGGAFNQPLIDAVNILSSLVDKNGKIAVSEILRDVQDISHREESIIRDIPFDVAKIKQKLGTTHLRHKEKPIRVIMHKTKLPSVSFHGFKMEFESVNKRSHAVVPNKVVGKFSVRLVTNQTAIETFGHLDNYIRKIWQQCKSTNQYKFQMDFGINPWQEDPCDSHYCAAAKAIELVYGVKPMYLCEGSTMPCIAMFKSISPNSNLIVLPIGEYDSVPDSCKESISKISYLNGIKLVMAYLCYINEIK
ncbi:cytosolic non-specific dipeptidase-like isoform X2 [Cephus cinctus]|uniref:Cytosolic non-specific dipeptidase-like isoform X2 n=1 Tax=Cephus cinctus TaxID=211228 RepID=A0AAJ7VZA3_CEPCN|nr:cytosolic non-specific dipeptidase-like isoform X2 [Cephus cinctus]